MVTKMKTEGKHEWKVAIAGECMTSRLFSANKEPDFLKLKEIMDTADVCYAHLEMSFGDFTNSAFPARGEKKGSYLLTDPAVAKDLRWLGINVMSLCHNHSYDFGAPVILETIRHCKEADITCAGTGIDLEEAREPGYREVEAGRVALIATTSGNPSSDWANLSKGSMLTRPGVNPQRLKMRYLLPEADAENLRKVVRSLNIIQENKETGDFSYYMPSIQSSRSSCVFSQSDDFGIDSVCHTNDLEGNLRSIQEAKIMSDFVMVAQHYNVSEGGRNETPPVFVREFAHAAIDAGADMYLGHGWHKVLGLEIYKGKPIFYGLGNFFAQSQFIRRVPFDSYEAYGHDISRLSHLRPSDEPLHAAPTLSAAQSFWWTSSLIEAEYKTDGQIKAINFYPVELGADITVTPYRITRNVGKFIEGRPLLATGENAQRILEWLQKVSLPFGTEVKIDGDIGHWES